MTPDCDKPTERMLWSEDLPDIVYNISGALWELVRGLETFADLLVGEDPMSYLTDGHRCCGYSDELDHVRGRVKDVVRLAWCYQDMLLDRVKDLEARFDQLMDMAEVYPTQIDRSHVERDRRVARYLESYDERFSSDRVRLRAEIQAQGGYGCDRMFVTELPGHTPKTVEEFANAIALTCCSAILERRSCQAEFRRAVLGYIELLLTLNNTIVQPHMGQALTPDDDLNVADAGGCASKQDRPETIARTDSITLRDFMETFCVKISKERLRGCCIGLHRAKILPAHEGEWESGGAKYYIATDLMKNWPEYRKKKPYLPELKSK